MNVQSELPGHFPRMQSPNIRRISKIAFVVSLHYGLTLTELTGRAKRYAVSHPRQIAFALIRELTTASLPQIGNYFDRDHTTILEGIQSFEARKDPEEIEVYDSLKIQLLSEGI